MTTDLIKELRSAAATLRTPYPAGFLPLQDKAAAELLERAATELHQYQVAAEAEARQEEKVSGGVWLAPNVPSDAMETANAMYGDTSDWWNAVRQAAPIQVSATTQALIDSLVLRDQAGQAKYGATIVPIVGWLYEYPDHSCKFVRRNRDATCCEKADELVNPGWDSRDALRSVAP